MKPNLVRLLRCPVCGENLSCSDDGKTLFCSGLRKHNFDVSKRGYVNLAREGGEGDGKDAVAARRAFLNAGYYQPLSDRLEQLLTEYRVNTVLDAGSGEGYYTERMADGRCVLGVDLSKAGVDLASRRTGEKELGYAVGSIFSLPVRDSSVDAVTNLFAPCCEDEFRRVLRPGGLLFLIGAGEEHLIGLKKRLYDHPYLNPGRMDLPKKMTLLRRERLQSTICVEGNGMVKAMFSMTPYYWRTSLQDKEKLNGIESLETPIDFDIFVYER